MRGFIRSLTAVPLRALGRSPDVALALGVVLVVAMLIIPLPGVLLDALIALNFAAAIVTLLVALFAKRALDVSAFPTLLLVTTLFRLGLNVSTTRGILTKADGGRVVEAFGHFVLQGDVVVGTTIFLVITLVQLVVIAKGAERVAEVAARFTLDAMPGKQMAIDAAVRAGALGEQDAEKRRNELARESQLFGNMDGAMKFVKGDAIAGLVITALNFVAGIVIGVVRLDLSFAQSLDTYAILSVGDGLVSQLPALLITLAAGVLVTRVAGSSAGAGLGDTLEQELTSDPRAMGLAAVILFALGLVPALPMIPFFALGAAALGVAFFGRSSSGSDRGRGTSSLAAEGERRELERSVEQRVEQAKAERAISDNLAPSVVPLGIDLDAELSRALGFDEASVSGAETELVGVYIPQFRDALYMETGVRFPGVRVRTSVPGLPRSTLVVRVNDVPVLQETVASDHLLALVPPESLRRLGVLAKAAKNPLTGATVALVTEEQKRVVEASGVATWNASAVVGLHLAAVMRRRAREFIGFQEVSDLVDRLAKAYPALVKEVVPKVVSVSQLVEVLRRLVEEGVSIRDLKSIVQALGENGVIDDDVLFLTERARAALATQIAWSHAGLEHRLSVVLLDPLIEDAIAGAITAVKGGRTLALDPVISREILGSIAGAVDPLLREGVRPVVLTSAEIRRYVRKLLEPVFPEVAVLSIDELPGDLTVQPMGRAALRSAA